MFSGEGSFARKQLEKHGWTEGAGLGKSQQGMNQAIRVKIKQDTTGVGHDPAKEFTDLWFERLYNKAAANLVVKKVKGGVTIDKKETTPKQRSDAAKTALYGNFVRASLLDNGTETKVEREGGGSDSDSSEDEKNQTQNSIFALSDEQLKRLVEGPNKPPRYRGPRIGPNKLAEIYEQERLWAEKNTASSPAHNTTHPNENGTTEPSTYSAESCEPKRKKKCKKRKRETGDEAENVQEVEDCEVTASSEPREDSADIVTKKEKKKKKKKRQEEERKERGESEEGEPRRKKKKRMTEGGNETVDQVSAKCSSPCLVVEENSSEVKKRKKTSKTSEVCRETADPQNDCENCDAEKSNKRSKSPANHSNASNQQTEENCEGEKPNTKSKSSDNCCDNPDIQEDMHEIKKRKKKSKTRQSEDSYDDRPNEQTDKDFEVKKLKKSSKNDFVNVCRDGSDSKTNSTDEEVCSNASATLASGADSPSTVDGAPKKSKKSKKKKKSKSVE